MENQPTVTIFAGVNGAPKLALSIATRWRTDTLGKGYIKYNHF